MVAKNVAEVGEVIERRTRRQRNVYFLLKVKKKRVGQYKQRLGEVKRQGRGYYRVE